MNDINIYSPILLQPPYVFGASPVPFRPIFLTGTYSPVESLTGRYAPAEDLTGGYSPAIDLEGS